MIIVKWYYHFLYRSSFHESPDGKWSAKINDTYVGMVGELLAGRSDFIAGIDRTYTRTMLISYTQDVTPSM